MRYPFNKIINSALSNWSNVHHNSMEGNVLDEQGQYREAEEVYREALRIRQRVLPEDHPEVRRRLPSQKRYSHLHNKSIVGSYGHVQPWERTSISSQI